MNRVLLLGALVWASATTADAQVVRVELRDGAQAMTGTVRTINEDGVTLELENAPAIVISWDRIREVVPEPTDGGFTPLQEMATKLWRARTRVERGDHQLAEPLFEEYFEKYLGRKSETALVVMEGLLRCRLARGVNDLAVIPALEVARLRQAGVTSESYTSLPPVYDSATALCPYLPPFWAATATLPKVARQLAVYDAKDDAVIIALAGLYRTAVQRHAGVAESGTSSAAASDQPGARLLRLIIDAKLQSEAEVLKQAAAAGPWAEAWAYFALGQLKLASDAEQQQQAGLLNLLRIPAQWADSQPYLSGLALAEAAEALAKSGKLADADVARAELQRAYPHHPVLATLPIGARSQGIKGGS